MNSKENSTPAPAGATVSLNLIDAIDLLNEARQINEAVHMACLGIADRQQRDALQRIVGMCGDSMNYTGEKLEAILFLARQGGAA